MNQSSDQVFFYNVHTQPFSNFYPSPFKVGEKLYKTAEHYYQSMKFKGTNYQNQIRQTQNIQSCHFMGQMQSNQFDSKQWDQVRENIYEQAVRLKFQQNLQLAKLLIDTNQKKIICIDQDSFWGMKFSQISGKLQGQNKTGNILMKIRNQLQTQKG